MHSFNSSCDPFIADCATSAAKPALEPKPESLSPRAQSPANPPARAQTFTAGEPVMMRGSGLTSAQHHAHVLLSAAKVGASPRAPAASMIDGPAVEESVTLKARPTTNAGLRSAVTCCDAAVGPVIRCLYVCGSPISQRKADMASKKTEEQQAENAVIRRANSEASAFVLS